MYLSVYLAKNISYQSGINSHSITYGSLDERYVIAVEYGNFRTKLTSFVAEIHQNIIDIERKINLKN